MAKPSGQRGPRPHPERPSHVWVDDAVDGVWIVHLPTAFNGLTPAQLSELLDRYVARHGQDIDPGPLVLEPTPTLEAISPPLDKVYETCPHGRKFGGFYCPPCMAEMELGGPKT